MKDFCPWISYRTVLVHLSFRCSQTNSTIFSECLQNDTTVLSGDLVLERTEKVFPLWLDLVVILGTTLLFRVIAYLMLRYVRHPGKHFKSPCLKSWKPDIFNLCKRRNSAKNCVGENGIPDNGINKG